MNEGKRPGGLTALAVINFIFFGMSLLSIVGMVLLFGLVGKTATDQMTEAQKTQIETVKNMGMGGLVLVFGLSLLSGVLLLLSGLGYLKQKRILGRMVGNIYAVLAIVAAIVSGVLFRSEPGAGFSIGTIINLIYPVLTLILINTTFKDDLTN